MFSAMKRVVCWKIVGWATMIRSRVHLVIDDDLSDFVWLEPVESNMDATKVMLKEEMCDVHV